MDSFSEYDAFEEDIAVLNIFFDQPTVNGECFSFIFLVSQELKD